MDTVDTVVEKILENVKWTWINYYSYPERQPTILEIGIDGEAYLNETGLLTENQFFDNTPYELRLLGLDPWTEDEIGDGGFDIEEEELEQLAIDSWEEFFEKEKDNMISEIRQWISLGNLSNPLIQMESLK